MKPTTVLLIHEDGQHLQSYGTALKSLGYNVLLCGSYTEGLSALDLEKVDLVIVSQGSQAFEGRLVLDRAAELQPRPPVLVVARKADMHCFFDALDMGAADYLENPELQDLLWTVATQVARPN
jgi:DNA-binding NtrC family response regulator